MFFSPFGLSVSSALVWWPIAFLNQWGYDQGIFFIGVIFTMRTHHQKLIAELRALYPELVHICFTRPRSGLRIVAFDASGKQRIFLPGKDGLEEVTINQGGDDEHQH